MAQYELNEALARAGPKKGEVRNPQGIQNPLQRLRNREIRAMLQAEGNEPCDIPGYEHLTKLQFMVSMVFDLAMTGERWAVTYITNRVFGRVPLDVEINATVTQDLTAMSDDQLLARAEALAQRIRETVTPTVDAEVVADPGEPLG